VSSNETTAEKPTTDWADEDYVAAKNASFFSRLYSGTGAFDVVGPRSRRRLYVISAVIMVICVLSMIFRGFTPGIDFEGGTQVSIPASDTVTTSSVSDAFNAALGQSPESVQKAGTGAAATIQVRTETLSHDDAAKLTESLASTFKINQSDVSSSDVSSTWGAEITRKMVIALIVFLVAVFIYIAIRFDREMSAAALVSLLFDVVATAGVYSLVGWEVTPATVIGLLTILGFSVYDTVVVFDKVEENTRSVFASSRRTYSEQTNLAVNQTFMRSINTTVISVLPIIALIVIAVWMLGVGTLKDLALIQLVGVVVGTYSSIFLASPLLVTLKEMREDVKRHTAKVLARRERAAA
jgi:preprotein translocase subunit SecF